MKKLSDRTWECITAGMKASVLVAFLIGVGLIGQDSSTDFLTRYYTTALPIALTFGGLVAYIKWVTTK